MVSMGLVTTIMMATLVVGPFYLSGILGLSLVQTGLVMSVGPAVSALAGAPAGRLVDRFGAAAVAFCGLSGLITGASAMGGSFCLGIKGGRDPWIWCPWGGRTATDLFGRRRVGGSGNWRNPVGTAPQLICLRPGAPCSGGVLRKCRRFSQDLGWRQC